MRLLPYLVAGAAFALMACATTVQPHGTVAERIEAAVIHAAVNHLVQSEPRIATPVVLNPAVLRWEVRGETMAERRAIGFAGLRTGSYPDDFDGVDRDRLREAATANPDTGVGCLPEEEGCRVPPGAAVLHISRPVFSNGGSLAKIQVTVVDAASSMPVLAETPGRTIRELYASGYTIELRRETDGRWRVQAVSRRWIT